MTAQIYDFDAIRANRLLGEKSRQAKRLYQPVCALQKKVADVDQQLSEWTDALNSFFLELRTDRRVCEKSIRLNRECQRALERDGFDELVEFRDRLAMARYKQ